MGMTREEAVRVYRDKYQSIGDGDMFVHADALLAVAAEAERRGREAAVATVREAWQRETASRMSATMPMWLRAALDAAGGAR